MPENAKIEVILQFLHDHSRLVCNELNKKADSQVWKTTPLTDSMRRNLIFHYGSSGFNSSREQKKAAIQKFAPKSPVPIDPEVVELNDEIVKFATKVPKPKSRLTIRKQLNPTANGIFSKPIQSRLVEIPKTPSPEPVNLRPTALTVSTSSIYADNSSQSDYENELFQEPSDIEMASFYHNQHQNSQWFQDHSYSRQPEDDSNWFYGSLEFASRPKTKFKIHSQPF